MKKKHNVLIVNQHGENRGDEAAMRAMLKGISDLVNDVSYTMVCQFMKRDLKISFKEDVKTLPMLIPFYELFGLVIFTFFKILRVDLAFILGKQSKLIIKSYKKADIVISAPGGPYFGDIYSGLLGYHELAHWFMIYIAKLYKKPALLYAPSGGPFHKKWLNPIRRNLYNYFSEILIREEISKSYIEGLIGKDSVHLAADSALQTTVPSISREEYFKDEYVNYKNKFIVSVSANDYKYPNSSNIEKNKREYFECMIKLISHISENKDSHFIMYPQLYGGVHSDLQFLERLGANLPKSVSWEIVDVNLNSDEQQAIWGMTDFTLASRYHPQIFSAIQHIPYLCIYYEHKQLGFVKALGLEEYAFDIYNLNSAEIIKQLDKAIDERIIISEKIKQNIQPIIERSKLSSKLVAEIFKEGQNA